MAKKTVVCPHCGERYQVAISTPRGTVAGVRSKKITDKQFEYQINVPGELTEDQQYWTMADQYLGYSLIGLGFGAMAGNVFGQVLMPAYGVQCVIYGALGGAVGLLCFVMAERRLQYERVLPYHVKEYLSLSKQGQPKNGAVELRVNLGQRDGLTEMGRTIKLFGALPVSVERFNEWAKGALLGKSLAIGQWTPLENGFSRGEYEALLGILQKGGCILNVPGKGNKLTNGGRRALAQHLKQEAARGQFTTEE